MSLSLEDKVQKCIKTPLKSSSDQTAWAIASKWMSHFVFICWRGGHSVKIDAFGSRPGNTPIISPQKPLQRAGLSAAERRNTRESSDRSHVSVSVWFHLSSVVSPTCAWNYPASLQAFIHFNSVVALSVMFLLYCRVSLAASGVKGQKTFRAVSWSPESEPASARHMGLRLSNRLVLRNPKYDTFFHAFFFLRNEHQCFKKMCLLLASVESEKIFLELCWLGARPPSKFQQNCSLVFV